MANAINWADSGTTAGRARPWSERKTALPPEHVPEHARAWDEFYAAFRRARSDNMYDNWRPADETEARVEFAIIWDRVQGDRADLQQVLNAIYLGAVAECEEREAQGTLQGNGHHMAQKISERVKRELIQRKLFTEKTE